MNPFFIAAQNKSIRTKIFKHKLILGNRISSVSYVESDMKYSNNTELIE